MTDATPAGWYPDPAGGGGQRYWDGATWTGHVAPPAEATWAATPALVPPTPTRGPVWPWVVGIGFGLLFVVAVLLAIAIPTFLGAKDRAEDRAAQSAARNGAVAIAVLQTDEPGRVDFSPTELAAVDPSLHFTTGPSIGPTDVSYGIGAGLTTVAVRSRSGHCWVVRRFGGTTQTGSLADGRPCEAALAMIHMTPEDF